MSTAFAFSRDLDLDEDGIIENLPLGTSEGVIEGVTPVIVGPGGDKFTDATYVYLEGSRDSYTQIECFEAKGMPRL